MAGRMAKEVAVERLVVVIVLLASAAALGSAAAVTTAVALLGGLTVEAVRYRERIGALR